MIEDAKRRSTSGSTLAAAMVIQACVGGRAGIDVPSIVADKCITGEEVEKEVEKEVEIEVEIWRAREEMIRTLKITKDAMVNMRIHVME